LGVIQAVIAAGVFIAVPIVGRWALGPLGSPIPVMARLPLWTCAGIAIWSVPLLGSAALGSYRPEWMGALGWVTVAAFLVTSRFSVRLPRLGRWDVVALIGILAGAALAARYAADPFTTGRDMSVYAQHALYIVHHGRLDVPYPAPGAELMPPGFRGYLGVFTTQPTMTVQFAHLYPAWLAQAFSVAGYGGLVTLNPVLGGLSLLTIYGIGRRLLPAAIAAMVTVFLALNPAQIWTTRNTLTEIMTQLLIWAGILLLSSHLTRQRPRIGFWAGALLGLAAVVRIDALLLVPLLLAGHAVWLFVHPSSRSSRAQTWIPVYKGAVPVLVIALATYVLLSRPYFDDLSGHVRQIGLLAVAMAILLAVANLSTVTRWTRAIVSRREFLAALLVGLVLLTAFAYFVRPQLPPFAQMGAPRDPQTLIRSHIEDALPNLGQYISPPAVWAAVFGWWIVFVAAVREKRRQVFLPLLVIVIGFSAIYLWNQSVRPDHFWAIRRFVPVVVPAFVLLAGVGVFFAIRRLPVRFQTPVVALTAAAMALFTWTIGAPTYRIADRRGSYEALASFAQSLDPAVTYLGLASRMDSDHIMSSLYVAFDRRVIPIDVSIDVGRAEAMRRLRAATPQAPVVVVTTRPEEFEAVTGTRTAETAWERRLIEQPLTPVPRTTSVDRVTLVAMQATGIQTTGVAFGAQRSWLVPDSGLHGREMVGGRLVRWTNGHARFAIPVEGPVAPRRLSFEIGGSGPQGTNVRLVLNGLTLFDGRVPPGSWAADFPVAGLQEGEVAEIEIISGTFVPAESSGSPDQRELGVMIQGINLLPGED
jgi:hypothetical protein